MSNGVIYPVHHMCVQKLLVSALKENEANNRAMKEQAAELEKVKQVLLTFSITSLLVRGIFDGTWGQLLSVYFVYHRSTSS